MNRLQTAAAALILPLLLSPPAAPCRARQLEDKRLAYQDRGDRYEGFVRESPVGDEAAPISLLSLTAHDREHDRREAVGSFSRAQFAFYLPGAATVTPRVTSIFGLPNQPGAGVKYRMDKVKPAEPWRQESYNHFAWPTGDVLVPLGFTMLGQLGFVAELPLPHRLPGRTNKITVMPVLPYLWATPDQVNSYSFVFRVAGRERPKFYLFTVGGPDEMSPRLGAKRHARPIREWDEGGDIVGLEWNAAEAAEGWYYIEAAKRRSTTRRPPYPLGILLGSQGAGSGDAVYDGLYGVAFYHRRVGSPEQHYESELQRFKQTTSDAVERIAEMRRRLKVIELPESGVLRPVAYAVTAAGPRQRRVEAYEAEAVREILRAGRSYIDRLTASIFTGIRDYVAREYPSPDDLPTIPDPRDPQRRLILRPVADKIIDRAVAVLREVNSLPSLYVIVDLASAPEGAAASLTTYGGKHVGGAVTPDKLSYVPRGRYLLEVKMDGFKSFRGEVNFMRSRVLTSIGCNLYAEGTPQTSRCSNPE